MSLGKHYRENNRAGSLRQRRRQLKSIRFPREIAGNIWYDRKAGMIFKQNIALIRGDEDGKCHVEIKA